MHHLEAELTWQQSCYSSQTGLPDKESSNQRQFAGTQRGLIFYYDFRVNLRH